MTSPLARAARGIDALTAGPFGQHIFAASRKQKPLRFQNVSDHQMNIPFTLW